MKKRVLAIAMTLAMTLSLLPVSALATETGETPAEETQQSDGTDVQSGTLEDEGITVDVYFNTDVTVVVGSSTAENRASSITEAINGGATDIALGGNVTEDVTIPEGKTVTIDLAGYTLTNSSGHTITNYGTLTIKDSGGNGIVDNVTHARAAIYNYPGGTVTLNGGTYTRSKENGSNVTTSGGNSYYTILNHGTMTINNGVTVNQGAEGNGKYSSLVENGWQDGNQNSNQIPSIMTINGGNFSGGLNTLKNDDYGQLEVNGGSFSSFAQACVLNWNIAEITGGTFNGSNASSAVILNGYINDTMDRGILDISGGRFTGNAIIGKMQGVDRDVQDVSITGGTFSSDVSAYVPENYECVPSEGEGTYTVKEMEAKLVVTPEESSDGNISATLEGNYSSSGTQIEKPTEGAGSGTPESVGRSVEINLTTDGQTEPASGGSTTLNITQATASSLSDASSLKVTTNEGTVELDNDALEKVGEANGAVSITVTKNSVAGETSVAASYTVEVKSGSTDLLPDGESSNGTITLTLPVPAASQGTTLYVWYAVEQSNSVMYVNRVATYNSNSGANVTFDVSHLSRYDLLSSEPNANETAVASITKDGQTTYYDSLKAAVDAVTTTNQTTIKLLKSTSGAGVKVDGTVKRNLTFDLGGHTYTITSGVGSTGTETNGFQLIKDNDITITNGTITAAPAEGQQVKILIQNYSNLTLENVTLDGRGMTDYSGLNYTLSNNNGKITLKSGTVIQARTDEIAMDVCWAASYQNGARVTVEEGAEIQGTVELGLWGQDAYSDNQSVLTVNGGTITGEVKLDSSITEDKISETIESLKTNVTINGGTFGSNVDAYVDSTDDANAHIARNGQYTYYETVQDALNAAQPGDSVVALNSAPDSTLCTVTLNYGYNSNRATIQVASDTKLSLPDPGTRTGYTFNGWYNGSSYVGREGTEVTITSDITYTADWTRNQTDRPSSGSGGSSSSDSGDYLITVDRVSGGRVTVQPGRADKGDTVTITVYPNDGYELDELVVTDSRGNEIDLDARSATRFTFTMPGGKVTVEASFVREGGQPQVPQTTFADVPASAWYYNAVEYVYENGLMSGVSGGRFAPDDTLTRAMLVQTLYAMEGRPAAASAGFADVASGDWYASAVNWAAANGVVSGVSETGFGPNNALTREQLALILYRFAQYKGYDVTGTSDLAAYADGSSVSGWAAEAMSWAVNAGLISGVGGNQIAPTGTASRAQVAQILMNFCENVAR